MMRTSLTSSLALPILLFVAGCGGMPVQPVVCPGVVLPAIRVEVLDSVTGLPAAGDAFGWVREAAYQDSLQVVGWSGPPADSVAYVMAAAYERPGFYTVEISHPSYLTWRAEGVTADEGVCGVETAELTAWLQPAVIPFE